MRVVVDWEVYSETTRETGSWDSPALIPSNNPTLLELKALKLNQQITKNHIPIKKGPYIQNQQKMK